MEQGRIKTIITIFTNKILEHSLIVGIEYQQEKDNIEVRIKM